MNAKISPFCLCCVLIPLRAFGFNGELTFQHLGSSPGTITIRVKMAENTFAWVWDKSQQHVIRIDSFDEQFEWTTGDFGFDEPKNVDDGLGGVAPWGLLEFELNRGEKTLRFTLDLRDEHWSSGSVYSLVHGADTWVFVDWTNSKIYLSKLSPPEDLFDATDTTTKIWAFWEIEPDPEVQNFRAPLILANKVGTANAGGSLHVNGENFSSSSSPSNVRVMSGSVIPQVEVGTNNERFSDFQGSATSITIGIAYHQSSSLLDQWRYWQTLRHYSQTSWN